jgi:hypothetical protein
LRELFTLCEQEGNERDQQVRAEQLQIDSHISIHCQEALTATEAAMNGSKKSAFEMRQLLKHCVFSDVQPSGDLPAAAIG